MRVSAIGPHAQISEPYQATEADSETEIAKADGEIINSLNKVELSTNAGDLLDRETQAGFQRLSDFLQRRASKKLSLEQHKQLRAVGLYRKIENLIAYDEDLSQIDKKA